MVTNVKEGKTKKCEQYWPDEVGNSQSYGPFNVTVVEYQDHSTCGEQNDIQLVCFQRGELGFSYITNIKLGLQLGLYNLRKTFNVTVA